jgi:hypothetical protein
MVYDDGTVVYIKQGRIYTISMKDTHWESRRKKMHSETAFGMSSGVCTLKEQI